MRKGRGLLAEIEEGALKADSDLTDLLRRCISLGGRAGSQELVSWATLELKGYAGSGVKLPAYRQVGAPVVIDGATYGDRIYAQSLPSGLLPPECAQVIPALVPIVFPLLQISELVAQAKGTGSNTIALAIPGMSELVTLVNRRLARTDNRSEYLNSILPPSQVVTRIYWQAPISSLAGIHDVVRTTLVELVVSIRAEMKKGGRREPAQEDVNQAVQITIKGNRNSVQVVAGDIGQVVNQSGEGQYVQAGNGSQLKITPSDRETPGRRLMWWAVGIASIFGAIACVVVLFGDFRPAKPVAPTPSKPIVAVQTPSTEKTP
jgi:hypothetical protein